VLQTGLRRRALVIGVLAGAAIFAGCGDDSPVTPGREPLSYSGRLEAEGFHSYALPLERGGTVRVEVTRLTPVWIEITALEEETVLATVLTIGVGIGAFDEEGACDLELRPNLALNRSVTVLLSENVNCLAVFDSGLLPDNSVVDYTVVVTDAAKSS
jgi:hypothetical protein